MKHAMLAVALLAAGCARLPVVSDGLDPQARATRLRAVEDWQMSGRLAVNTGERAFQARFRWHQTPAELTLTVSGLLGAGGFQISGNAEQLTVLSRGEVRRLIDPEPELSALFGWWLPVTSLESWLLGLPDGRFPGQLEFGADGMPGGLDQRLWRIRYDEFQLAEGILIPKKITLAHAPLQLELSVDRWARTEPAPDSPALN
jgi:outer membrane lipoprotein LolB